VPRRDKCEPIGLADPQLIQEDARHGVVVVLTRVYDALGMHRAKRARYWRGLDELRTGDLMSTEEQHMMRFRFANEGVWTKQVRCFEI